MNVRRYLPSMQFVLIICSFGLSAALVYAADLITHPPQTPPAEVSVAPQDTSAANDSNNWEATLYAIQSQNASSSLPAPNNPQDINALLAAVQSPNLTDTIGKSILINLTNAKSQGLGDDIPTQDQIVAAAAAQIKAQQAAPTAYTAADLTIVPVSDSALRAYGNGVMTALSAYPAASEQATFVAIDYIVEGGDKSQAATLANIGAAYKSAAAALLAVPVPQTLVPLDLEAINNLLSTAATYDDTEVIGTDPVRGLVGFKTYEALMDNGARVFTNIAEELNKDGIIFTKDEPGSAWGIFLAQPASPGISP